MEKFYESFQTSLIVAVTHLLNDQPTRKHIDVNELSIIIEPFTDSYEGSQDTRKRKWTLGTSAIAKVLRSWTGVICLTKTPLGLKALVQSLRLQDTYQNDITLDVLFTIFHIQVTRVTDESYDRAKKLDKTDCLQQEQYGPPQRHNLLDNYQAVLLTIFNEFKLIETLIALVARMNKRSTDSGESKVVSRKAVLLIAELLHLSNQLLPASQCAKLQGVPKLMRDAINFSIDPHLRSLAGTTIGDLEKLALTKRTDLTDTAKVDYFDDVKKNFDANMDESTLKQKLNESVLMKKDMSQYNWDIINELIEGPLTNPVHYQSPLVVRFIKKVLSFFRPSNKIFPNMSSSGNEKYGRIACVLIQLIIRQDNASVLSENQLISEICDILRDEVKGTASDILSQDKILCTMTSSYFEMIGTLSSTKTGLEVLNKHKIFDYLPALAALPSRDDICNLIIKNLDYNTPGPSRVVLAKSLNAQSQVVRYLATKRLQVLMRSGVSDFTEWGIRFLVQKLSDESTRVSSFALGILEEAACDKNLLDSLINKRAFDVLAGMGKPGKDLLTRFLSRESGFSYLSSTNFVENELIFWKATGYISYVKAVESSLADAFASPVWRKGTSTQVNVPVHLYGELVQTEEGIRLLEEKEDVEDFLRLLCSNKASSLQKRGALWILGHIGKSKLGYKQLFAKYDVLRIILHIANTCSCLGVRGTCFYALGLICSTSSAASALKELGWESKRESFICVPVSIKNCAVFSFNDAGTEPSWPQQAPKLEITKFEDERDDIVKHFTNLSCKLTFDKSLNALKGLKSQNPDLFQDYQLQYQIFKIMEYYHFQLPPRRFFNTIFDVFWSLDKLNKLPSYNVEPWKHDVDGFADFPSLPSVTGAWSTTQTAPQRQLTRNLQMGAFGSKGSLSPLKARQTENNRPTSPSSSVKAPSPVRVPTKPSSPSFGRPKPPPPMKPQPPEQKMDVSLEALKTTTKKLVAPPQRKIGENPGRGQPLGRGPPRARPPRGLRGSRGAPPRPPRAAEPGGN